MSLSEMLADAITNAAERDQYRGRTDWAARQFIRRQYKSGKTNFYEVFDFYSIFTPIEFAIWQDIAAFNLPFLPQYPVGKYFADFADPKKHIAIECDGKQHNPEADKIRDAYFQDRGWEVIRIPGRNCFGERGTEIIREIARRYGRNVKAPGWEVYETDDRTMEGGV